MKPLHDLLFIILFWGMFLPSTEIVGQIFKPGPQVATFYSEIDDSEQPYGLYIPPNYDPGKQYPLVIMLHGAGSNHRLALRRVFGKSNLPGQNDAEASRVFPKWKDVEYIVATPYARGTMGYVGIPEADVMRVIEECRNNFSIDENRIYLTGLSMGGGGTFYIGLTHPGLFAALAPVCPAPPESAYELMGNALNLPIVIYQGSADQAVKAEGTRLIAEELKGNDTPVEYHEFPGVPHSVWVQAYLDGNIFKWFDGIYRNPYPERVRYASKWYKYNAAYWVLFDKLTPGTLATMDARYSANNTVDIKSENLEAFTLRLKGHPDFKPTLPLTVKINGVTVQSPPKFNHSFYLKEGKWACGKFEAPVMAKKPGLEGPLYEVLTSRVLFVYGTEGVSGNEGIDARRQEAQQAANFSSRRGNYTDQPSLVNPRVISDKQVTADDFLSSNLFLLGTKETNTVIAKLADLLPVHLNNDAKEYGLVYCYPVNGKMVLIASGIPFWTARPLPPGEPPAAISGRVVSRFSFASGIGARALTGRKDFLLFKETNDQVITEGYFDHNWQLSAGAIQKMKDSGAVWVK